MTAVAKGSRRRERFVRLLKKAKKERACRRED